MIKNHWGVWVDSEEPITGVHSIHDMNWESYDDSDEICPICINSLQELEEYREEHPEYDRDAEYSDAIDGESWVECDSSHSKLIGDWIVGEDKLYTPIKNGPEGYSAIMNEDTIQVLWSEKTERHALCSPCYPGQADADSDGEYLCYVLPDYLIYKGEIK